MRSVLGVLYAAGGALVGFVVGVAIALLIAKLTDASNREGAVDWSAFALGLVLAVIGLVVGIALYTRSAPTGQGVAYGGSALLGIASVVAVVAVGIWTWLNLMEKPLEYDGAMATLELELRLDATNAPIDSASSWLGVEVQTAKTRPEGTVYWSAVRTEGGMRIVPVAQNPLIRATNRVIVVRLAGRQTEVFTPPIARTPDSRADWSTWYRPQRVESSTGDTASGTPSAARPSMVELRYRVRRYGE